MKGLHQLKIIITTITIILIITLFMTFFIFIRIITYAYTDNMKKLTNNNRYIYYYYYQCRYNKYIGNCRSIGAYLE